MIDFKKHFPEKFGFFQVVIPFVLSLLLIAIAAPRLIAGLMMVFPNTVFEHIQTAENPKHETILKAVTRIEQALHWNQNSRYWFQIGSLYYELINSDEYAELDNQEFARQAIQADEMCLSQSPSEPDVWYLLAVNRFIVDKYDSGIPNLLKNSIYTGRIEQDLMLDRLAFLTLYIDEFDDELNSLAKDQVRLAWDVKPEELIESVIDFPELEQLVNDALGPDELELFREKFEEAVSKS